MHFINFKLQPVVAGDMHGGGLLPPKLAEQILADLIKQGVSGEELLSQLKLRQAQIRPAVEKMFSEAGEAAAGKANMLPMSKFSAGRNDI